MQTCLEQMLHILKDGVFDDVALALQFGVAKADADERLRIRPMSLCRDSRPVAVKTEVAHACAFLPGV